MALTDLVYSYPSTCSFELVVHMMGTSLTSAIVIFGWLLLAHLLILVESVQSTVPTSISIHGSKHYPDLN